MTNGMEINQIIMEVIDQRCDKTQVRKLLKEVLRYELNIWNRPIAKHTITEHYEFIVDKIVKEG
jgi:hypothetical protein